MRQHNLSNAIYSAKFENGAEYLTENQQAAILEFVGKGCRLKTKASLKMRLSLPLSVWQDYGIYSRIILSDEYGAEYVCGQSWNDEMRTLRECMINL